MTFRESMTAFGDHVLDKTLGTVEAGACVISHNQFCACVSSTKCGSHLQEVLFSCFGACNVLSSCC